MTASSDADVLDMAVEFDGSKKHTYIGTVAGAMSKSEGKARILAFFQKSKTHEQSTEVYVQVDAKYKTAEELKQSNTNANKPHAEIKFKLGYSLEKTFELASINGDIKMKQSPELKTRLSSEQGSGMSQNAIDHIDIELDMKKAPKEMLEREFSIKVANVYGHLRYATIMFLSENFEYKGEKDKLSFEMRLSSDMSFINATLKTPAMKSEWKGVPVPKMVKYFAVVPMNGNMLEELKREIVQYRDTCMFSGNNVNTFENRTMNNVKFYNTWHLAVHKMRESNEDENNYSAKNRAHYVSVMVRDVERSAQNENMAKEVLIVLHQNTKNDITLRLSPSKQGSNNVPRLFIDENEMDVTETMTKDVHSTENNKQLLARAFVSERDEMNMKKYDLTVETEMGKVVVIYNGEDVQIRSNSLFRNNYGVCGSFTGQQTNEMRTPDNKIMQNEEEFVASWALIEHSNTNSHLKQMQQRVRNTEYPKEKIEYGNPVANTKNAQTLNDNNQWQNGDDKESTNGEQFNEHKEQKQGEQASNAHVRFSTKHQTQYVEDMKHSRICFSKRPLPVCAPGTRANGKLTHKVEVYCRDINDPAAQQYKSQILSGRNLDLSNYSSNARIKFTVPKRCEQL